MTNELKTISVSDFMALHQGDKNPVVIDVRSVAEMNNEYFQGSVNLPIQGISAAKIEQCVTTAGGGSNEAVYLLCGTGQRARRAAEQCATQQLNPLVIIEGGLSAMKQQGVTLKKGSGSVISLERQVRIAAGSLVLLGVLLGLVLHPAFYGLTALVGAGLIFAGVTNTCGMAMALARMPWNTRS